MKLGQSPKHPPCGKVQTQKTYTIGVVNFSQRQEGT